MDYPSLRLEVLEIFAEAQHEATNRRAAHEHQKWAWFWRVGRFGFPIGQTELGRLPAVVTCLRCGHGITSSDPRVVQSHVRQCGAKQTRVPQRR